MSNSMVAKPQLAAVWNHKACSCVENSLGPLGCKGRSEGRCVRVFEQAELAGRGSAVDIKANANCDDPSEATLGKRLL